MRNEPLVPLSEPKQFGDGEEEHPPPLQRPIGLLGSARLGENWTAESLAKLAGCSTEHLRRLCHQLLGRTPMHQVTYLRMRHAANLLETRNDKIETISRAVGYENPFAFSNTFKKWIGWRPSEYRGRKSEQG